MCQEVYNPKRPSPGPATSNRRKRARVYTIQEIQNCQNVNKRSSFQIRDILVRIRIMLFFCKWSSRRQKEILFSKFLWLYVSSFFCLFVAGRSGRPKNLPYGFHGSGSGTLQVVKLTNITSQNLSFWISPPVPEIIDPVFAKTSQNARFLLSENERFGLVFVKTGSINSGTENKKASPRVQETWQTRASTFPVVDIGTPRGRNKKALKPSVLVSQPWHSLYVQTFFIRKKVSRNKIYTNIIYMITKFIHNKNYMATKFIQTLFIL
jgi:hypothetical protein